MLGKIEGITNIEDIKRKYKDIVKKIKDLEEAPDYERLKKLSEEIRRMRRSGLEEGGEFSIENLTFKVLRRKGFIGKLIKLKKSEYDRELSLKEIKKIVEQQVQLSLKEAAKDYIWGVKGIGRVGNKFGGWIPIKTKIKKRKKR